MAALRRNAAPAALIISLLAFAGSLTGFADAARRTVTGASSTPRPGGVLRLDRKARFPARVIPKVAAAKRADSVGGLTAEQLTPSCAPTTVDLGTWCLQASPFPVADQDVGKTNYLFATQACVQAGGYLPTAAQLVGAAGRVKLSSVITDAQLTASIDLDGSDGLRDRREMSATLVTTAAGSSSAGSEGVSDGSRGDPKQGEPDPVPVPANPTPDTLQYVTVYDNGDKGGFAGSRPVGEPDNFRCAFEKVPGAAEESDDTAGGGGQGTATIGR